MHKRHQSGSILLRLIVGLLSLVMLSGCNKCNPQDPLEVMNRGIYGLNKFGDRLIVKPVALAYDALIPSPIRCMVCNFFQNFTEIPTIINDVLQGKFRCAANDAGRFALNTTWGIGGLFDLAARGGFERHREDFGQTLACWGWRKSIYLVLPLLGPSTIRDAIGRGVTYYMSPWPYIRPKYISNDLYLLYLIDYRASLFQAESALMAACAGLDEYSFVRDAYLQNRKFEITDGAKGFPEKVDILEGPPD